MLLIATFFLHLTTAHFIEVGHSQPGLLPDLYLTKSDNPVGISLLSKKTCCIVHKGCFSNLLSAGLEAKSLGYQLKIVDALRPLYVQQALFAIIQDKKFVSLPGSEDDLHSRGLSVDILLTDAEGQPLPMPSPYFESSVRAFADYDECSEEEKTNREILADIMVRNGFNRHPYRWWEFQSSYWESLSSEDKKSLPPFTYSIEEFLCPQKGFKSL